MIQETLFFYLNQGCKSSNILKGLGFSYHDCHISVFPCKLLWSESLTDWHCMYAYCSRQNCAEKMESFLSKTFYLYGGYDNKEGMSKLDARMELLEVKLDSTVV